MIPETVSIVKAIHDFFRKKLEILHLKSVFESWAGIYILMGQLTTRAACVKWKSYLASYLMTKHPIATPPMTRFSAPGEWKTICLIK